MPQNLADCYSERSVKIAFFPWSTPLFPRCSAQQCKANPDWWRNFLYSSTFSANRCPPVSEINVTNLIPSTDVVEDRTWVYFSCEYGYTLHENYTAFVDPYREELYAECINSGQKWFLSWPESWPPPWCKGMQCVALWDAEQLFLPTWTNAIYARQ